MRKPSKINIQFSFLQGSYWLFYMPISAFSTVILQERLFSAGEIGFLLAFQAVASIVGQSLIAAFSGRHPNFPLKRILQIMQITGTVVFLLWSMMPNHLLLATLTFGIAGATIVSIPTFINALAMQLEKTEYTLNYGLTRGIGSLTYAVGGFFMGQVVQSEGFHALYIFIAATGILSLLCQIWVPNPKLTVEKALTDFTPDKQHISFLAFMRKNRKFSGFCAASFFLFFSTSMIFSFMPDIYYRVGGNIESQTTARAISALVELPAMALYGILVKRIRGDKLLIFSSFSFFVRALGVLIAPSVIFLHIAQVWQMPAYGLYTPAAVHFSDRQVSSADRVRAQAIAMVASSGLGGVLGNLVGGALVGQFGISALQVCSAAVGAVGFLVMFFSLREREKQPQPQIL